MVVARLKREHVKLRFLGAELKAAVSCPKPCDFDMLARRRWDLARMVHLHLAYEERQLFSHLSLDPRPAVRAASARAKREVENLHNMYKAHVERWTVDEVTSQWSQFQSAVEAMVGQMIVRIDREETNLFPLIEGDDVLRRCWQPGMRNWAGDGVALQPMISAAAFSPGAPSHPAMDTRPLAPRR